ncbi:TusE/DsrC/DsvC family sulfur relay protein [Simiduia litorea]|uniref:TusE/DsrC/DsvC family sulfur relay protein n=1 Tax=Simiduia litorea TaxID=1435348 RepID=UPI0036F3073D
MREVDKDGYLINLKDWSPETAEWLAAQEKITLTDAHWEIIYCLRDFYQSYELSPAMRPLVKHVASKLGADKGRSLYLMRLFPESPAKIIAKIAGLPRPTNCL